ncbi:PAS domain S-box protein [Halosimplex pelagicum]|uniref:histidine kinase n=1 Tax=Halosimplex pelagicum TaxID=869886 RepID=A0A7D5PAD7_9EURY|nr:PAS domain S-box protein [Halosimplex pelagicum]QLH84697.1 PAS domain S-box protein [Halosimplex pelagicum]
MGARVLAVGPERDRPWVDDLEADGWDVVRAASTRAALSTLGTGDVACVVVERGDGAGADDGVDPLDALAGVREFGYDQPVLVTTAEPDGELAAGATRLGVTEYVPRSTGETSLADRVRANLPDGRDAAARRGSSADEDGGAGDGGGAGTSTAAIEETAAALDAVSDGLYVLDLQGRFAVVNESLAAMAGRDADELVGEHVSSITTEAAAERVFPAVRRVIRGESEAETVETTVVPDDGEPFPAEDHLTAVEEGGEVVGVAGVLRDVTDKRERTRELERYESIIEAVDDGVYALDDEGRFEVVNDALVELTGYDREELVGEHTALVKDEETVQRAENKLRDLIHGNAVETTFDLDLVPESGEPVDAEDHMVMLSNEDGEFAGTAGVIRDITDRKAQERELRAAREQFAELLDTSRALLGAHSAERVGEIVVDAVAHTLGFDMNVVRIHDAERDVLVPLAASESDAVAVDDRPDYAVGEGGPGRAFETGEIRHAPDDLAIAPGEMPGGAVETLYVPLGDQGAVSIGATEPGAFDGRARELAEILAANAAVALDRVAYESELVRYRTVIENVQDMVYVADEEGRFSLVTEPLATWLGVARADLVGRPVAAVLADPGALDRAVDAVGDGADSRVLEADFERVDGASLPAEIEVSPLPDEGGAGTVGVVRDRTELVETRERLETQRDRFTYLFDNLPDAVVEATHVDGEPVVTAVNDAFADVFGYDASTISGESLNEFVLPEDEYESGRDLDRQAAEGETVQSEVRRRTADGYRDFLFRGIPYDTGGDEINSFGIYTDITDQKERERRLQVLNRVLRHNLRNDLNVVLGYAEMIASRVDDETVDEWAETLIETASDVASLGDRARSLDRTMREGALRDHEVGVESVVDAVVSEYRREHADARIETDVDDARVVGDGRIELALTELIENSVEYGGDGVHVRVESDRSEGRVDLRVDDDGPGIPDYERTVVDESTEITQLEHGSGLGLWIVRWVVDSCGGRLRFEESDLGGTAVVLSLTPAEAETADD